MVSLINLGCKVNQYELDQIKNALRDKGHSVTEDLKAGADICIINTCAVTQEAMRKSRQHTAKVLRHNPDTKIIVFGCASEIDKQSFFERGATAVFGSADNDKSPDSMVKVVESLCLKICDIKNVGEIQVPAAQVQALQSNESQAKKDDSVSAAEIKAEGELCQSRSRQYIKVQDGCDSYCAFCIVPYIRGDSRSRSAADILDDIAATDLNEVVLIGINLSSYSYEGMGLSGLLRLIGKKFPSLRLRLGSLEANVIDEKFLAAAKASKNFCPHFHLSLQSGDDKVLADMNRKYRADEFYKKVLMIRQTFPNAAITTDVIVGFPTEGEQAYFSSYSFIEKCGFADIHIFPFSARKGTAAERIKQRVPSHIIKQRAKKLAFLKDKARHEYMAGFIDTELNVLIEEKTADKMFAGYSENYIRVYTQVQAEIGQVYRLKIKKAFKDGLLAGGN